MTIMAAITLLTYFLSVLTTSTAQNTYRAAIVNFPPPIGQRTLNETIRNVYSLAKYATEARLQGADIFIFPEYGITGFLSIDSVQDVPDPKIHQWNPCIEPDKFPNTELLFIISCAARLNSLVITANLISREPCSVYPQLKCKRTDGYFYFNTNVVFYQNGTLAARYYKTHLFGEKKLTPAPEPELTIVDFGFAKFGIMICFDLMYEQPTLKLYKEKGITNFLFPTAWVNTLPFFTALQAFNGFARGLGVNIIAANLHYPRGSYLGSGLFSGDKGVLNVTNEVNVSGKLIYADVPVNPISVTPGNLRCTEDVNDYIEEKGIPTTDSLSSGTLTDSDFQSNQSNHFLPSNTFYNFALNNFTFVYLNAKYGSKKLCNNNFCCHLEYEFLEEDSTVYAFAVLNAGLQATKYFLGFQICSILRCESENANTCGKVPINRNTKMTFKKLTLLAKFNSDFVMPQILGTDLNLIPDETWNYNKLNCKDGEKRNITLSKLQLKLPYEKPIMVASLSGRIFSRDFTVE